MLNDTTKILICVLLLCEALIEDCCLWWRFYLIHIAASSKTGWKKSLIRRIKRSVTKRVELRFAVFYECLFCTGPEKGLLILGGLTIFLESIHASGLIFISYKDMLGFLIASPAFCFSLRLRHAFLAALLSLRSLQHG